MSLCVECGTKTHDENETCMKHSPHEEMVSISIRELEDIKLKISTEHDASLIKDVLRSIK